MASKLVQPSGMRRTSPRRASPRLPGRQPGRQSQARLTGRGVPLGRRSGQLCVFSRSRNISISTNIYSPLKIRKGRFPSGPASFGPQRPKQNLANILMAMGTASLDEWTFGWVLSASQDQPWPLTSQRQVGKRTNKAWSLDRGNPKDCSSNRKEIMHRSNHKMSLIPRGLGNPVLYSIRILSVIYLSLVGNWWGGGEP